MDDITTKWKLDLTAFESAVKKAKDHLRDLESAEKKSAGANDERMKSGTKRAEEEARALKKTSEAAADMSHQLMQVAAQQFALGQLKNVVSSIAGAFQQARDKGKELADEVARMRESLVSLASVMGGKENNKAIRESVAFAKKTAIKLEEVPKFREAFQGRANAYSERFAPDEFDKTEQKLAAAGAVTGIDTQVLGDMGGSMIGSQDWAARAKKSGKSQSDEINLATARVIGTLSHGAGENKTNAANMAKVTAKLVSDKQFEGVFKSPEEAAAVISLISEVAPDESEVFVRGLVGGLGSFQKKETAPLLAEAGINKDTLGNMSVRQQLEALAPVVKRKSKEQNLPISKILEMNGFDEKQAAAMAVGLTRAVGPEGILAEREAYQAKITPETMAEAEKDFQTGKERAGTLRIAQANEAGERLDQGMARNAIEPLLADARASLRKERRLDTTGAFARGAAYNILTATGLTGAPKYEEQIAQDRAQEMLLQQGDKLGIELGPRIFKNRPNKPGEFMKLPGSEEGRVGELNRMQDLIQQEQARLLKRIADAAEKGPKLLPAGPKAGPSDR